VADTKSSVDLKPGQSVRIEVLTVPRARHRRIALNYIFRQSVEVSKRWNEHNGEPRKRESMKIPRTKPNRRRVHDRQRYQLLPGAHCEIAALDTRQIADLASIGAAIKIEVVKQAPAAKVSVFGK